MQQLWKYLIKEKKSSFYKHVLQKKPKSVTHKPRVGKKKEKTDKFVTNVPSSKEFVTFLFCLKIFF
jgi:hypothetical protein